MRRLLACLLAILSMWQGTARAWEGSCGVGRPAASEAQATALVKAMPCHGQMANLAYTATSATSATSGAHALLAKDASLKSHCAHCTAGAVQALPSAALLLVQPALEAGRCPSLAETLAPDFLFSRLERPPRLG